HAGVEAVGGDAHLEAAVLFEDLVDQLDQLGVVVHEQHFALAALEGVGRDAVVLHDLVERLARDAPEARAGDPEAFQLAVVEATDDGLLAHLADLGGLAGREHGLHAYAYPSLARGQFARDWSGQRLSVRRCGTEIIPASEFAQLPRRRCPDGLSAHPITLNHSSCPFSGADGALRAGSVTRGERPYPISSDKTTALPGRPA